MFLEWVSEKLTMLRTTTNGVLSFLITRNFLISIASNIYISDLRPAPLVIRMPGTSPRLALLALPGCCGTRAQAGAEGSGVLGPRGSGVLGALEGLVSSGAPMDLATCDSTTGTLVAMQDNPSCPKPVADGNVRRFFFFH